MSYYASHGTPSYTAFTPLSQDAAAEDGYPSNSSTPVVLPVRTTPHTYQMAKPKKTFGALDIVVVAFNISQAWAAIGATLGFDVAHGGPPALIYRLTTVTIVYLIIALSAAELAANFGTAGGQ